MCKPTYFSFTYSNLLFYYCSPLRCSTERSILFRNYVGVLQYIPYTHALRIRTTSARLYIIISNIYILVYIIQLQLLMVCFDRTLITFDFIFERVLFIHLRLLDKCLVSKCNTYRKNSLNWICRYIIYNNT